MKFLYLYCSHGNCGDQESSKRGIIIGAAAASACLLVTAVAGIIFFMWRQKIMPRGKFDKKPYPMTKSECTNHFIALVIPTYIF